MNRFRHGLLYGRFQPFHNGHLYLLRQALKKVDKLTIGIGSANIHDENNPLTYEQRKEMIETVIKKENISEKINKIVPLNDFYNDNLWYKNTIKQVGKIDVVIGNNQWTNKIFFKNNYKVLRIRFYRRNLYEGIKIRKLIEKNSSWQKRVPEYLLPMIIHYLKNNQLPYRFDHVALGGTFDHFHIGHIKLIETAFKYGKNVSIGITSNKMCKTKILSNSIENYSVRKKSISDYLKKNGYIKRSKLYYLQNIFGPTLFDGTIEALVVSKQTFANMTRVNQERKKRGFQSLDTILVSDVMSSDKKTVSSERIRAGEINRQGYNYFAAFQFKKTLHLPNIMREEMRKPIGKVFSGDNNNLKKAVSKIKKYINKINPVIIIAVGDIISSSMIGEGFYPNVQIIDYRTRRHDINIKKDNIIKRKINLPGTISFPAINEINKAIRQYLENKKNSTIVIRGEEDLLVLPAILFAPLNSVVLYGQFDLGVVVVWVTEEKKKDVKILLQHFEEV